MNNFKLEAPWNTYQKKIAALFAKDDEISVGDVVPVEDGDVNYALVITVDDFEKYVALDRLLPDVMTFGNVTLGVIVRGAPGIEENDVCRLYRILFENNKSVHDILEASDQFGGVHNFIRFKPEVLQFPDDNTSSYNGLWSGLAEDIAKELFWSEHRGIHFCTAPVEEFEHSHSHGHTHVHEEDSDGDMIMTATTGPAIFSGDDEDE